MKEVLVNRPKRVTWNWLALNGTRVSFDNGKEPKLMPQTFIDSDRDIITKESLNIKVMPGVKCRIYKEFRGENDLIVDKNLIEMAEGSEVVITHICSECREVYISVETLLNGRGGKFRAENAYTLAGKERLDMNYTATALGEKCLIDMRTFGSLFDEAKKIYRGTIDFKKGSAGSKGSESEDVLLLSPRAINKTLPVILCTEEDVDGVHGATIGRLDKAQLYYLMSRGLNEGDAERLIARERVEALRRTIPLISEQSIIRR